MTRTLGAVRRVLAVAVCVAGTASGLQAQHHSADSVAVVAAVVGFHSALTAGDSVKAVSMLSDDVVVLESGVAQSRAEYLGHHLGADMKASKGSTSARTVTQVTVVGNAAYMVSTTFTPGNSANPQGSDMVELMVLSKAADGWKIRAVHWSSRRRRA